MDIKRKPIIISAIVFVVLALAVNIMYGVHKHKYMTLCPDDGQILVKIKCDIDRVKESGSVGNEWSYDHFLNNQRFKDGDTLTINTGETFSITSRITEHDDISDIGEANSGEYTYDDYKKPFIISQRVRVVERGGRRYAGSYADFNVVYTVERVLPPDIGVWDVYFYTLNVLELLICVCLIIGQIVCIAIVIRVIVNDKKKKE